MASGNIAPPSRARGAFESFADLSSHGIVEELRGDDQTEVDPGHCVVADAPVTCQFMLEDRAVRHSYHHLASIQRTLNP